MIKKFVFIMSALFGLGAIADMYSDAPGDHMSDMMSGGSETVVEEVGFSGSFELKYKSDFSTWDMAPTYRARFGWSGNVNDQITWGVGVSSLIEQGFEAPSPTDIHFEQAYVTYEPAEGFYISVGKFGWKTHFNKTGVMYDDDLYPEGAYVKYKHGGMDDQVGMFAKVAVQKVTDVGFKGPFEGTTFSKAKLGGHYAFTEGVVGKAYVSAQYDGLFSDEGVAETTLGQVGVQLSASDIMDAPVGFFGVYSTDIEDIGASYNVGAFVGGADNPSVGEMDDFGVSVSYYDLSPGDVNTDWLDGDYTKGGSGIAARVQYNVWDNANIVLKYTYALEQPAPAEAPAPAVEEGQEEVAAAEASEAADAPAETAGNEHNFVAELTFNF